MKYCPQCGAQMQDDDVFCSACGTRVDAFGAGESSPSAAGETILQRAKGFTVPKVKATRSAGATALICILIAAAFFMAVFAPSITTKGIKKKEAKLIKESAVEAIDEVKNELTALLSNDDVVDELREEYGLRLKKSDVKNMAKDLKTLVTGVCEGRISVSNLSSASTLSKKLIDIMDKLDSDLGYGMRMDTDELEELSAATTVFPIIIIVLSVMAVLSLVFALLGKGKGFSIVFTILIGIVAILLIIITGVVNEKIESGLMGLNDFGLAVTAWPFIAFAVSLAACIIKPKSAAVENN